MMNSNRDLPGDWGVPCPLPLASTPFDYADGVSGGAPMLGPVQAPGRAMVPGADAGMPEPAQYGGAMAATLVNPFYASGYLRTQVGKTVRVEFTAGQGTCDRVGTLMGVGADYILLKDFTDPATILCDLFSAKFVTIVDDGSVLQMR